MNQNRFNAPGAAQGGNGNAQGAPNAEPPPAAAGGAAGGNAAGGPGIHHNNGDKLTTHMLPTYYGEGGLDYFIDTLEFLGAQSGWQDAELGMIAVGRLKGHAATYVRSVCKGRIGWPELKQHLRSQFEPERSIDAKIDSMMDLKQRKAENMV